MGDTPVETSLVLSLPVEPEPGCPFQPRCPYSIEKSTCDNPPLVEVAPQHSVACWVDVRRAQTHSPGVAVPDDAQPRLHASTPAGQVATPVGVR